MKITKETRLLPRPEMTEGFQRVDEAGHLNWQSCSNCNSRRAIIRWGQAYACGGCWNSIPFETLKVVLEELGADECEVR